MSDFKMMDLPTNERPREKLFIYGPETLSNSELLAIIIGCGTKGENVLTLCTRLLAESKGLNQLLRMDKDALLNLKGIKYAKAAQILALGELSKRFRAYGSGEMYKISSPKDAANYCMEGMRYLEVEVLKVILLNTKNVVIGVKEVSRGTINSSIVHPREVFNEAIKTSAKSLVICHNHPSGDPTPSSEDINVTKRLYECSKIIGIDLLDHIIIGDGEYISLKEKGII